MASNEESTAGKQSDSSLETVNDFSRVSLRLSHFIPENRLMVNAEIDAVRGVRDVSHVTDANRSE